jgi:D-glycero-D-manno-heptose 1,7-bisphosphate phosphatase
MSQAATKRRAVFLDRDGVINMPIVRDGRPYSPSFSRGVFSIYPEAAHACALLKDAGFRPCRRNQSTGRRPWRPVSRGGRGHARADGCSTPDRSNRGLLRSDTGSSECYKPAPGMLLRAAARWRWIFRNRIWLVTGGATWSADVP